MAPSDPEPLGALPDRAHCDQEDIAAMAEAVSRGDAKRVKELLRLRPQLVHMDRAGDDEHRPLHYAVLNRDAALTRVFMEHGADAHKGIYPHRECTTPFVLAKERGYDEIVAIIEEEERARREAASCPNATISPLQDQVAASIAAGENDVAIALLERDSTLLRACDRDGGTPLHAAAAAMNLDMVRWLLKSRADAKKADLGGHTPIDRAVLGVGWRARRKAKSFEQVARLLVRRGCELTPLAAAALGDLERLRAFHQREPQRLDDACHRAAPGPLSVAVTFGQHAALELLLGFGLDPEERYQLEDLDEPTFSRGRPLWLASAFGEHAMAELLLTRGADPNSTVYASGWPIDHTYQNDDPAMRDLLRHFGAMPHPSTIGLNRDFEGARELLERAAEPRRDTTGAGCATVAEELLWGAACGGDPAIVAMCLPHITRDRQDPWWSSILEQPMRIWNHGPNRDPDRFDRTTYPACLKLLLDHGIDPNVSRRFAQTPLHFVVARGPVWGRPVMTEDERLLFARQLLDAGARLDLRDALLRSTPLGWACRYGRMGLVELFLQRGAPTHEPDAEPWATPLAWATKMGQARIVDLLHAHGAAELDP